MDRPDLGDLTIYCSCQALAPIAMMCIAHDPPVDSVLLPLLFGIGGETALYQCTLCGAKKVAVWHDYGSGYLDIRNI